MRCRATCPFWNLKLSEDGEYWVHLCDLRPPKNAEVYREPVTAYSSFRTTFGECVIPPFELRGHLADLVSHVRDMERDLEAEDSQSAEEDDRQLYCDPSECPSGECEECAIALEDDVAQCDSCGQEVPVDELCTADCGHRVCNECVVEDLYQSVCRECLNNGFWRWQGRRLVRVDAEEIYCAPARVARC